MASSPRGKIEQAAAQLRQRQVSAAELVERCLARIEHFEDEVHAWVLVDAEGARREAEQLDALARQGTFRGPLHGIPLGIKDIVDVAPWPTMAGSTLRRGHVASRDATIVQRLRQSGAILLGKTVTTEFASFDPPVTRNPWNTERTPGGSSSGSAAAVALGMCLGAIGSQTGGSITRPASYCGVAGLKPSYGRVPLTGIVPLAWHLDHPGPIAGSVADLALMLEVMAGADAEDPTSAAEPIDSYHGQVGERSNGPRLGALHGFFLEQCEHVMQAALESSCNLLRQRGAVVEAVEIAADAREVLVRHRRVMAVEAAEYHRPWFPARRDEYGDNIAALIDEGWHVSSLDYAEALRRQTEFRQQTLQALRPFDALVLAATPGAAPTPETTGNPKFNSLWSYAGLPTVSFPCGVTPDGMPLSLQLVGRMFGEGALLATAAWCERQINFAALPPLLKRLGQDNV